MPVKKELYSEVKKLLFGTYRQFRVGNFIEARRLLDQAHALDFEDQGIKNALRACGFWTQRISGIKTISGNGSRGDYLRRQWTVFENRYSVDFSQTNNEGCLSLKIWVHTEALQYYRAQKQESNDSESMLQIGRCLKVLGCYEEAIQNFKNALKTSGGQDSRCMADLADAYALIDESKPAKVLMREAMHLGASRIELDQIEAPLFRRLIDRLRAERNHTPEVLKEWLPVYGALWGVLDAKRELNPAEYGKLKQTIYALKSEITDGDEKGKLTPRLINKYIRLIDHYESIGADRSAIEEILMNIKLLSPSIHGFYLE